MICGRSNLVTHLGFGFGPADARAPTPPLFLPRQAPAAAAAGEEEEEEEDSGECRINYKRLLISAARHSAFVREYVTGQNKLTSEQPTNQRTGIASPFQNEG